ncbi:MAG TPA: outer membrane protein assembly factor BamD, partial [bacterium]|nr:outer membrane protein assembly factor BamD [bacterium]
KIASEAQYRLGTILEEKGDYWKAFQTYKALVQSYPQSDRLSEVIEREFRIGNLFLSGKKAKLMGLEILPSLPRAVQVYKHIVEQAPFSDYGDKAQFHLGLAYKKWKHYDEAIEAFQAVLDQYPQSPLVPEARFQLAETSYDRSAAEFRDQRTLDEASSQVSNFLTHYPDSMASEKAATLRQQIDEKNAEKNYRIGLYYEKQNYLESALIYYSDVAARYPHTKWGEKSTEKMKGLKEPASYLSGEEAEINQEISKVEEQLNEVSQKESKDSIEEGQLKRQLDRLKHQKKALEKNKGESLKRRREDLKRRQRELKGKFKKLAKKRKLLNKNPSEDLKQALDRWTASLEAEQVALEEEKAQLGEWRETLGVKESRFSLDFIPFVGEAPSALESVKRLDAKKLYEISNEKKNLLSEKELLYKQYGEVSTLLQDINVQLVGMAGERAEFGEIAELNTDRITLRRARLKENEKEIVQLKKEIKHKQSLYEKKFGEQDWLSWAKRPARILMEPAKLVTKPADMVAGSARAVTEGSAKVVRGSAKVVGGSTKVVTAPAGMMARGVSRSFDMLNPFDSDTQDLEKKDLQELLERRMHLQEKIAAGQNLVDTLTHAFDTELAMEEQKRLIQELGAEEEVDLRVLRKSIKRMEKDIRSRYEEIEDRHEKKKELLKDLDAVMNRKESEKDSMSRAASAVTAPFVGAAKLSKSFLFGLTNKDVALTQSAEALDPGSEGAQQAKAIKKQIEMESLVIEAKNREIAQLEKEYEILKAQASLAGGYKFRSAFVTVPYQFMKEAVESANRLVPKSNRQDVLIGLLDKESGELETARRELAQVDQVIRQKTEDGKAVEEIEEVEEVQEVEEIEEPLPVNTVQQEPPAAAKIADEDDALALQEEIQMLMQMLEIRRQAYLREKSLLNAEWKALTSEMGEEKYEKELKKQDSDAQKQEKSLRKELKEIEEDIAKLIEKESDLEKEEASILEKRIKKIDHVVQKVHSKALVQDLLTERDRMESRLSQLDLRRDFLSKEMERFDLGKSDAAKI